MIQRMVSIVDVDVVVVVVITVVVTLITKTSRAIRELGRVVWKNKKEVEKMRKISRKMKAHVMDVA